MIEYCLYVIIILAGLILLALLRRKSKKALTPETVRQNCLLLKKKLESILSENINSRKGMFNQAKMMKLCSYAEDVVWCSSRLVDERKDMVFDDITERLDRVADMICEASSGAFIQDKEAENQIRMALNKLNDTITEIDKIISLRTRN